MQKQTPAVFALRNYVCVSLTIGSILMAFGILRDKRNANIAYIRTLFGWSPRVMVFSAWTHCPFCALEQRLFYGQRANDCGRRRATVLNGSVEFRVYVCVPSTASARTQPPWEMWPFVFGPEGRFRNLILECCRMCFQFSELLICFVCCARHLRVRGHCVCVDACSRCWICVFSSSLLVNNNGLDIPSYRRSSRTGASGTNTVQRRTNWVCVMCVCWLCCPEVLFILSIWCCLDIVSALHTHNTITQPEEVALFSPKTQNGQHVAFLYLFPRVLVGRVFRYTLIPTMVYEPEYDNIFFGGGLSRFIAELIGWLRNGQTETDNINT